MEPTSQVYVPSDPAFGGADHSWQAPITPAGALDVVTYPPESPGPWASTCRPGYDRNRAIPYPLMVIHHGGGGHEAHWLTQGVANRILDNVLASGRMQPAVVIFPNINGAAGALTDLMNNILPFVQARTTTSPRTPNDRAVGGLSLGGARTNDTAVQRGRPTFGYYGMWSSAGGVPAANSPLWQNPALKTRHAIHTSVGLQDVLVGTTTTLQSRLAANGIPHIVDNFDGGHEWHVWRLNLREFASKVAFRSTRVELDARRRDDHRDGDPGDDGARDAHRHGADRGRPVRPAGRRQGDAARPERERLREGALQRRRALQREQRHDHLLGDERHRRRGRHRARDAVADARAGGDASARWSPASRTCTRRPRPRT